MIPNPSNPLSKTIRIDVLPQLDTTGRMAHGGFAGTEGTVSPIRPADFLRFFENAYDATLITDNKGSCVVANRRVTDILGYDASELTNKSVWQLISGADATLVDAVRESLASERFLRISAWCFRKDGTSFPAAIAVNHFVSEKRRFFCFFIRDETLRTEAENQLRTIQNAVHNAGTGIAVSGMDSKILYANPAFATLCGVASPEDLANRKLADILGDAELCASMMETVRNGLSAMVEIPLHLPDGQIRWGQISTAPNLDAENTLIGMVISLVDIGDRRRAEQAERVVERDRVMMESLGAVCHHLGQPATVLLSSLEMLNRMKPPDPVARLELLQMSLEAAESLRKTLLELNDLRHYQAEPYPGPSAEHPTHIVAVPPAASDVQPTTP
jgi:PAS domain S-box-containing protein